MSVIKKKYEQLAAKGSYLEDTVVLAQAWKKTHNFIRKHNWYADGLELDCSVVDLEQQIAVWSAALQKSDYAPEKLRLVPAHFAQTKEPILLAIWGLTFAHDDRVSDC